MVDRVKNWQGYKVLVHQTGHTASTSTFLLYAVSGKSATKFVGGRILKIDQYLAMLEVKYGGIFFRTRCRIRDSDGRIDSIKILRPTRHKVGHFGDALFNRSLV